MIMIAIFNLQVISSGARWRLCLRSASCNAPGGEMPARRRSTWHIQQLPRDFLRKSICSVSCCAVRSVLRRAGCRGDEDMMAESPFSGLFISSSRKSGSMCEHFCIMMR
jgi:hypothetical protein